MHLAPLGFRIHRWLSWLVGWQFVAWVCGGLVFAWLPFQPWVKGGDAMKPPVLRMPAGWAEHSLPALRAATGDAVISAVRAVATPHGPAWRLTVAGGGAPLLVPVDGSAWRVPDADAVRAYALTLYRGDGAVAEPQRLAKLPRRLGIVDESGGRADLWRVRFDDALGTRLYFDGASGEFVAVRNEAWVWYDFFWRLHIMDYAGGEDFNGILLRGASLLAFGLMAAGALLSVLALRRRLRARRAVDGWH